MLLTNYRNRIWYVLLLKIFTVTYLFLLLGSPLILVEMRGQAAPTSSGMLVYDHYVARNATAEHGKSISVGSEMIVKNNGQNLTSIDVTCTTAWDKHSIYNHERLIIDTSNKFSHSPIAGATYALDEGLSTKLCVIIEHTNIKTEAVFHCYDVFTTDPAFTSAVAHLPNIVDMKNNDIDGSLRRVLGDSVSFYSLGSIKLRLSNKPVKKLPL